MIENLFPPIVLGPDYRIDYLLISLVLLTLQLTLKLDYGNETKILPFRAFLTFTKDVAIISNSLLYLPSS